MEICGPNSPATAHTKPMKKKGEMKRVVHTRGSGSVHLGTESNKQTTSIWTRHNKRIVCDDRSNNVRACSVMLLFLFKALSVSIV